MHPLRFIVLVASVASYSPASAQLASCKPPNFVCPGSSACSTQPCGTRRDLGGLVGPPSMAEQLRRAAPNPPDPNATTYCPSGAKGEGGRYHLIFSACDDGLIVAKAPRTILIKPALGQMGYCARGPLGVGGEYFTLSEKCDRGWISKKGIGQPDSKQS